MVSLHGSSDHNFGAGLGLLISNANTSFIALGGQVTSLSAQIIPLGQKIKAEKNGDTVLIRGSPVGRGELTICRMLNLVHRNGYEPINDGLPD